MKFLMLKQLLIFIMFMLSLTYIYNKNTNTFNRSEMTSEKILSQLQTSTNGKIKLFLFYKQKD